MSFQIPKSSKMSRAIFTLHILAVCKLALLICVTVPWWKLPADTVSIAGAFNQFFLQILLWGAFGIAFAEAAAFGLSKNRAWGWFAAVVVAFFHLMSIFLPFSIAIAWFLLPDSAREQIRKQFEKEIEEKPGS